MTRSNLSIAMSNVDAHEAAIHEIHVLPDAEARKAVTAEAERLLAENEAAAKAEALAEQAAREAAAAVQLDITRRSEAHADAIIVVNRAKARMGHDVTAIRPADALAVEIISRALWDIQSAPASAIADAFNASSSAADIAKGAAVVAAQSGA